MPFAADLQAGRVGEGMIAGWLRRRGCYVVPAYEIDQDAGKGPRIFAPDGRLIAPDMLCLRPAQPPVWVEAKHKSVFSWYRKLQRWETGIDWLHWLDYVQVQDRIGIPVWLLFLHRDSVPWAGDAPHLPPGVTECPIGLFGISVDDARGGVRMGREHARGMAYWPHDSLTFLASTDEVCGTLDADSGSEAP